eukprot:6197465-Pleurochrysis_carterae.AAC.3
MTAAAQPSPNTEAALAALDDALGLLELLQRLAAHLHPHFRLVDATTAAQSMVPSVRITGNCTV